MSNPLGKALTTVFVLGVVVSFSSLLFLILFYNFSVIPTIPVIISVLVCAAFQLAAYLGGVVFQKRIWPSILCMLVCSVGTAWAGAVGPGALFGMPGTLIANLEVSLSNPLYLASMPVTIVGCGAGIAYFVLGVSGLLYDSHLIRKEREGGEAPASPEKTADKAAIYSHVTDMLGVTGEVETGIVAAEAPAGDDTPEVADAEPAAEEDIAPEEEAADVQPETDTSDAVIEEEADSASDEADAVDADAEKGPADDVTDEEDAADAADENDVADTDTEESAPADEDIEAATDTPAEEDTTAADAPDATGGTGEGIPAAPDAPVESDVAPAAEAASPPAGSVFSRLAARVTAFFAVEQPADEEEWPTEIPAKMETRPEDVDAEPTDTIPAGDIEPPDPDEDKTEPIGDSGEEPATSEDEPETEAPEPSLEESAEEEGDTDTDDAIEDEGFFEENPEEKTHKDDADDRDAENCENDASVDDTSDGDIAEESEPPETDVVADVNETVEAIVTDDTEANFDGQTAALVEETPADKEPPPLVTMRRSELLASWADTPYTPVPPQDLAVTLETDRLRIIRLDRQAFAALLQGIEEMEAATGLTPSGEQLDPHALDTFDSLYSNALDDPQTYKWYAVWIIASREENKLLGSAGFRGAPDDEGEVELAYGVNETRRGNDYASEAAVALCQWALLQKDVQAVTAQTDLANMESEALVEKAGMRRIKETSTSSFWRLEK